MWPCGCRGEGVWEVLSRHHPHPVTPSPTHQLTLNKTTHLGSDHHCSTTTRGMQTTLQCTYMHVCARVVCTQGRIEPPKAARGHATRIDSEILIVTKNRF